MSFFNLFSEQSSNKISGQELKKLLDSNTPPILIDVRTPDEFSGGHIVKSKNVPLQVFEESIKKMNINPSSKIVVYCQSGMRSSKAANILNKLGFKEIYNLGGIGNWNYGLKQ